MLEFEEALQRIQVICINRATGKTGIFVGPYDRNIEREKNKKTSSESEQYILLRKRLLDEYRNKPVIPTFVKSCLTLDDFWSYIKTRFTSYRERREYLKQEFENAMEQYISNSARNIADIKLDEISSETIKENWKKAIARAIEDPAGSITSSRSLIESTCKYILQNSGVDYVESEGITELFRKVRGLIFPNYRIEGDEYILLIGSVSNAVDKIKVIRDKHGDSHGHSDNLQRTDTNHAVLIANLSVAICLFLYKCYEDFRT